MGDAEPIDVVTGERSTSVAHAGTARAGIAVCHTGAHAALAHCRGVPRSRPDGGPRGAPRRRCRDVERHRGRARPPAARPRPRRRMAFERDEVEFLGGLRHGRRRAGRWRSASATPSGPSGRRS
jgi:hypothetical protein